MNETAVWNSTLNRFCLHDAARQAGNWLGRLFDVPSCPTAALGAAAAVCGGSAG